MLSPSPNGPNCADLPPQAIDKMFNGEGEPKSVYTKAAKNICARCVVVQECRDDALYGPTPIKRGVRGGLAANELRRARAWLSYEQGVTDKVPREGRPEWLPRAESAEIVESIRSSDEAGDD
jgi:hypothetical protein